MGTTSTLDRLSPDLLASAVRGRRLGGPTLRDQLDRDRPTLLVFLRHFG